MADVSDAAEILNTGATESLGELGEKAAESVQSPEVPLSPAEISQIKDDVNSTTEQATHFGDTRLDELSRDLTPEEVGQVQTELDSVNQQIEEAGQEFVAQLPAEGESSFVEPTQQEIPEEEEVVAPEPETESAENPEPVERIEVGAEDVIFHEGEYVVENLNSEWDGEWLEQNPDIKQKIEDQIAGIENEEERAEAETHYRNNFSDNFTPEEEEAAENFQKETQDEINKKGAITKEMAETLASSESDQETMRLVLRVAIKVSIIVAAELAKEIAKDKDTPKELAVFLDTLGNVLSKKDIQNMLTSTIAGSVLKDPNMVKSGYQKFVGDAPGNVAEDVEQAAP